jgi:hypothetical protein
MRPQRSVTLFGVGLALAFFPTLDSRAQAVVPPKPDQDAVVEMSAFTFKKLPGRIRFQMNISNLFDRTDIIPARLAISASAPDGFEIPGGRGVAYSRYDLVAPREIRFTTTYSF